MIILRKNNNKNGNKNIYMNNLMRILRNNSNNLRYTFSKYIKN